MATFVRVHGAWHGSWCWQRVRTALQAQGHEVFTPTLTGVGERSHLLSAEIAGGHSPFEQFLAKARARGWRTHELPCGHDVMIDQPAAVTELLLAAIDP